MTRAFVVPSKTKLGVNPHAHQHFLLHQHDQKTMSSNLDQSLDDIISSKPRAGRRRIPGSTVRKPSSRKAATKKITKTNKPKSAAAGSRSATASSALNPLTEAQNLADRIIISNLV